MLNIRHDFTVHPRAKAPRMHVDGYLLEDVYKCPSVNKRRAFAHCKDLCERYGGRNFCISSHNTNEFCVMFDFVHPETGELMRAYITRSHKHAYYL